MKQFTYLAQVTAAGVFVALAALTATAPALKAQVAVNIGPAPVCPYGYYDVPPYACAPYGYYGPEWFAGGLFIGAGPWFHGDEHFRGHVNNRFHPDHGYRGPMPHAGDRPEPGKRSIRLPTSRVMKCAMGAATSPNADSSMSEMAQSQ